MTTNSRPNYNSRVHIAHTRMHLRHPAQMTGKVSPLGPTEHLHKATLPSPGDVAALPKHRNKHREAAKLRTQRNMFQMKE